MPRNFAQRKERSHNEKIKFNLHNFEAKTNKQTNTIPQSQAVLAHTFKLLSTLLPLPPLQIEYIT